MLSCCCHHNYVVGAFNCLGMFVFPLSTDTVSCNIHDINLLLLAGTWLQLCITGRGLFVSLAFPLSVLLTTRVKVAGVM